MNNLFFKKIRSISTLLFISLIGTLYFVIVRLDTSSLPINPELIPETTDKTYHHRQPVVLVSYADGPQVFFKNQNSLLQSAINKGFDAFYTYRKGHLDPEFYEKNKQTLDQPRGAGYWLWKPYLILKTMKMYPDDAVIVYADSGVVFAKSIEPFLKALEKKTLIFVGNGKPVTCRSHLKMEARQVLQMADNDPRLDAQKIWAFFMVIKNTPQTRAFVEKWLNLCLIKDALTDKPFDRSTQDKRFNDHLHDEALLSVVAADHCEDLTIIPKNILRKEYGVINFHRHPEEEYSSPLFVSTGIPQWLSALLFNNIILQKIRQYLM